MAKVSWSLSELHTEEFDASASMFCHLN